MASGLLQTENDIWGSSRDPTQYFDSGAFLTTTRNVWCNSGFSYPTGFANCTENWNVRNCKTEQVLVVLLTVTVNSQSILGVQNAHPHFVEIFDFVFEKTVPTLCTLAETPRNILILVYFWLRLETSGAILASPTRSVLQFLTFQFSVQFAYPIE